MQTETHPIVVAVPWGGEVESVLHFAAVEARVHGCGLRLVLAHPPGGEERAEVLLRRAAAVARLLAGPSIRITVRRVAGPPIETVLADSNDARAVVLRSRDSLHLLRTLALGVAPICERVPIVCVPSAWSPRVRDPRPVLLGIEDPDESAAALTSALQIAHAHGTSLRVLHTWQFTGPCDDVVLRQVGSELSDSLASSLRSVLSRCQRMDALGDVPVEVVVRHGIAADVMVQAAADAQVMVLSRNRPSQDGSVHLGRTTRASLHEIPCPVVLLAAEPDAHRAQLPGLSGPMHLPAHTLQADARGGRRTTARSWSWTPPKASPGPVDV